MAGISPLSLANYADDPMFQLARAANYSRHLLGTPSTRPRHFSAPALGRNTAKLRIGYVSSDLREHAVGFAFTDLFETHDKASFEIYAYYCGINRTDATQARIKRSVDGWFEINGLTDQQAAAKIEEDKIDILIDLNGFTRDARTKVFGFRPAPIIVNWFGFPGTMGSPCHHYLIADEHIIPEGYERYYSEKVVRLPCYQPNDRKRVVAPRPARKDENLPEGALRLLLPQRHAEDHPARLQELDDDPVQRAGQRAVAAVGHRRCQRAPHQGRRAERHPCASADLRREAAQSAAPGPLSPWPTCSSTRSPTAPTPRPPTPCGWACRSSPCPAAASPRGCAPASCAPPAWTISSARPPTST